MKTLHYNHYTVSYRTAGDPRNPCIVMLHPAFGDHRAFEDQFEALAGDFFLIAPDMLGHGRTQPRSTRDQLDATIQHVDAILDQHGVQACHLLGVSLGALVAQAFASAHPQRTLSVTSVGGYSIHKNYASLQKAQNQEISSWLFKLIFNMKGFREYIARQSTYHQAAYQRMLTYTQLFSRKSIRYLQGMGKLFTPNDAPIPYRLLIVYGDHELEIALEHGQQWAALEPNARLEIIADAGHCANMEQPQAFNAIFREFLGG